MHTSTVPSFSLLGWKGGEAVKTPKKILLIFLTLLFFCGLHAAFFGLVTSRCRNNFSDAATMRSIDVENYLPFDENSRIPNFSASLSLKGQLPVLDGATALLPVYSAVAHALYPGDSCPFVDGAFLAESAVQYRNTVGAYKAIVDGAADIVFCAAPSEGQREYARDKGVELVYEPIGLEAFVFFVNSANPVDGLTSAQIRDIYSGRITDWAEVGGPSRLIHPISRKEGSGSQSAMLRFMNGEQLCRRPFGFLGASIGFSFRWYVEGIVQDSRVKLLAVDGAFPTAESIRNGSYPIVSNFYAIYRKGDPNPNIQLVVEWLLSDEGQQLIEACGYVPLR